MARDEEAEMKVRRCPLFCHDKHCPICSGTGYIREDGKPAMPEEMLEQLTAGKKSTRSTSPYAGIKGRR
jgi:hypothetical protein